MSTVFGLSNIHGSCYINTVLQCLFNDVSFIKILDKIGGNTPLFRSLNSLYKNPNVENIKRFIVECRKQFGEYLDFNRQNDIHEYLILLIDKLNEEIGKKEVHYERVSDIAFINYLNKEWLSHHPDGVSEISNTYNGQTITQIICPNCKETFKNAEVFTTLSLSLDDGSNIQTLVENYFVGDEIENWKCDKCKTTHTKINRIVKLTRYPSTLIITLKRFDGFRQSKNNKAIGISDLVLPTKTHIFKKQIIYKLFSIGCHVGCSLGGHYFAMIKDEDDEWLLVDDDVVANKELDSGVEISAYTLFYTLS